MIQKLNIRKANQIDADTIAEFNIAMAQETEEKELNSATIQSGVRQLFDHPEYGFYIVAEIDNKVAGCLMITYEWSDWRNGLFWWIQSVYIKPEFRRKGIYRQMYEFVKKLAKDTDVCGFRLYVEKGNTIAQKTYENLGMNETIYKLYEEKSENSE